MEDSNSISVSYASYTPQKGIQLPYSVSYSFNKILNITEEQIPFIKPMILIKDSPELLIEGISATPVYDFDSNYYTFYGDTTLIYKGYTPEGYFLTEEERISGNFQESFASKWYYGTLQFTAGGDSYEVLTSYIVTAKTYYDVVPLSGHPGYYSYKIFECSAIDSISASSITGTGTYTVVTATEVDGDPVVTTVITKNSNKTAPMFEDNVVLNVSGTYRKNGVYQYNYPVTFPLTITFVGTIIAGVATLTDFEYDWSRQQWKLFFSSLRASWFLFNTGVGMFTNLPHTTDYQSGTLPYTKIYVDLNPEGYPEVILTDEIDYSYSGGNFVWTKIDDNKYTFRMVGTLILSSPALQETTTNVDFIDESYSQSGETYVRDAENREDKLLPFYTPQQQQIETKLILSYNNPSSWHRERHRVIENG